MQKCDKTNLRLQQRCLKDFLNSRRQLAGKTPFKTITKFKKMYELDNENTWRLAKDLNNLTRNTYPARQFEELENLRRLIASQYLGKAIRLLLMVTPTDKDADIDEHVINTETYIVPATEEEFNQRWNSWSWHWRLSESNMFIENSGGKLYITQSELITPLRIVQSYMKNETLNCVFKPIMDLCDAKMADTTMNEKTKSGYKTLHKKVMKMSSKYPTGVPENELDDLFKQLRLMMTLTLPFCNAVKVFGETDRKKYLTTFEFINTRLNHIEAGINFNNDKPTEISEEEFDEFEKNVRKNSEWNIYKLGTRRKINIRTLTQNYTLISGGMRIFYDFENFYKMGAYKLDDVKDELISKFIRTGCHMTMSRINDKYRGKLETYISMFKEIDGNKAYASFKQTKYYDGFIGKITDFRRTDKIIGVGFYLIGNLDWTNANQKLKEFQRTFDLWRGRNIYASPELKFLTDNGVKFKIWGGCWGTKFDFDFTEEMFEKHGGTPNYSRWVGLMNRYDDTDTFYMDTDDKEYAGLIVKSTQEYDPRFRAHYDGKTVMFATEKKQNFHLSQVSGFIYAYQRLNLVEQVLLMDIKKIIRINTDGIKYLPHVFQKRICFRHVETPSKAGLVMEDRTDGFLTNVNCCNKNDWMRFHIHFIKTQQREHYHTELFKGAGGNGKTHFNLMDIGLVKPLYVANAYRLIRDKEAEYKGYNVDVLANLTGEWQASIIKRAYNVLIIDEASMISDELKNKIMEEYPEHKLIFCGDIGYQAKPIEGKEICEKGFNNVSEFTTNYRCKDTKLLSFLTTLRTQIDNKKKRVDYLEIKDLFKSVSREETKTIYDVKDMILTYKKETMDEYNKLIDKEKYIITKSTKEYSKGDIFYEKITEQNIIKSNAATTHSVQGMTVKSKLFIDQELLYDIRLFYTAVSRAQYIDQIYIVV
jgi:hypothetical protein